MNTGWFLIGIGVVMATLVFLVGLYYSRITPERLARLPNAEGLTVDRMQLFGRGVMYAAPFVFLLFLALGLGWIPVGIDPATFN